jgi:prepilin signal peptidase PulO-like enzyme (type II secretory pathway)
MNMVYLIALSFFALGAVLASFTAVVAERLHTGQSWVSGRSRCNSCSRELSALDMVPVLSWLFSRGRCRSCEARVPAAYALGEFLLGAVFVLSYLKLGLKLSLVPLLLAFSTLAFIVMYDLRHTVVPPASSWLLIAFSFLYAVLATGGGAQLGLTLMMAGVISLGFFLLYAFSRGRAMGLGDTPVAFALALLAGASLAIPGLLFSFWIGAIVGIAILATAPKGHRMGIEVPFVPFLAAGYLLAFFTQWNPLFLSL